MLTKNPHVLGSISTMLVFVFGASASQAGLNGEEVTCSFQSIPATFFSCDKPVAVVGAGVEFGLLFQGVRYFDVDISDTTIRLNYVATVNLHDGIADAVTFGNLHWTLPTGENIAIEDLEVQNFLTEGTSGEGFSGEDKSGVDIGDVSFSANSITFSFFNTNWTAGTAFVAWDLVVKQHKYIDTTSLSDLNGNNFDAVVVLRRTTSGHLQVLIKDTSTNELINAVPFFWSDWTPIAVAGIDANHDSVDDVAVLAVNRRNGKIKVQVRDALTGAIITQMAFLTPGWSPIDLMAVDGNGDGVKDLGVLAVHNTNASVVTLIKDVATKQRLTTVPFY